MLFFILANHFHFGSKFSAMTFALRNKLGKSCHLCLNSKFKMLLLLKVLTEHPSIILNNCEALVLYCPLKG